MVLQIFLILVLLALVVLGLWQAAQAEIGPGFLLYLIPIVLGLIFIPLLAYRTYALWRASYLLERDGIYLRWGLREEKKATRLSVYTRQKILLTNQQELIKGYHPEN